MKLQNIVRLLLFFFLLTSCSPQPYINPETKIYNTYFKQLGLMLATTDGNNLGPFDISENAIHILVHKYLPDPMEIIVKMMDKNPIFTQYKTPVTITAHAIVNGEDTAFHSLIVKEPFDKLIFTVPNGMHSDSTEYYISVSREIPDGTTVSYKGSMHLKTKTIP